MKVKFWGVRGSIPCPGPNTIKYGGNTACVEIRFSDCNRIIIIDAGTGIKDAGSNFIVNDFPRGIRDIDIFITHTHLDHIMGFPFFSPIYIPNVNINIHGPVTYEDDSIEKILGGLFTYRYFPKIQSELSANITYFNIKEDEFNLGDGITLITQYLNHPILCLGYKFKYKGKSVCTLYDTEPFRNIFCTDPTNPSFDEAMTKEGSQIAKEENLRIQEFIYGSDILIYDAQYTNEEYDPSRIGWGHTPIQYCIESVMSSKIKKLILFHHDPERTDSQIEDFEKEYCDNNVNRETKIYFAKERTEIEV
ncbi:MAG: MBL fold metallo-hydrolase [Desulfobacterales bacterium]|nr:MBL fold metallo-hydrolase [Desulfobacterales bacterium]